jgi:hypothetical protein
MAADLSVERLAPGDARREAELEAFFAACPTSVAQQTPGWRDVIASVGPDEPLFLGCRRRGELVGVLPAYRYAGPLGAILVSCAQAGSLGGVACRAQEGREAVYAALLDAFVVLAGERGCALASVISNPFWPDAEICSDALRPHYVLENTCQVLDLAEAFDAGGGLRSASDGLRRNLRRAEAAQLVIDEEQSAANVEAWYEIHAGRHREIGATPLPRALFRAALEHAVPRDKARFFFVRRAGTGELAGGGFYVHHGAVMDAFMPAIPAQAARLGAGFLLAWHTIQWARRRGVRFYNWQASPPEGGTARFKRQWGSVELRYAYLTRVTGDAEPFLRADVRAVREGYAWHYALPFDRVGEASVPEGCARSSRAGAWGAAEEASR